MGQIRLYDSLLSAENDHVLLHAYISPHDKNQTLITVGVSHQASRDTVNPCDELNAMPIPLKKGVEIAIQAAEEQGLALILIKDDTKS